MRCIQVSLFALLGALVACDPGPVAEGPPPGIDSIQHALSTIDCSKSLATGYKSGSSFQIVVVHVDGKPVQIDTANAYYVMAKAAAAAGVNIKVVSGFRTYAQQQYLYNCYINCNCNNCNPAAKPGYSEHNSGHALDLNTSAGGVYTWLKNNAGKYGFKRTVPSEAWHWEWWGGGPGGGPCGGGDKAYYGISCLDNAGSCQSHKNYDCASGDWRTGLCPGGADVQCCTFYGVSCADGAGTCQSLKNYDCASGDWRSGLCPGGTDVKCCINQPQVPDVPLLTIATAVSTHPGQALDPCTLGDSSGVRDLYLGDSAIVTVDLSNVGTAAAANTRLAIATAAPFLEVRSWRILRNTGDGFAVDDSEGQQRGSGAAGGQTFDVELGTIAPDATKRLELTVVATAASFGVLDAANVSPPSAAPGVDGVDGQSSSAEWAAVDASATSTASDGSLAHAVVRAWVAHVDDYYDKANFGASPVIVAGFRGHDGGDLKSSIKIDVLGPDIPNGVDDDCDGVIDLPGGEPGEGTAEGTPPMTGGCATAPSTARPAWWPLLLALVGLLGNRRRRARRRLARRENARRSGPR